jgi:DNA-binding MarR family transcriptional regulator
MKSNEVKAFARILEYVHEILALTLDFKRLDSLHKSKEALLKEVIRKRPRSGQVKTALKRYLSCLEDCVEGYKETHPPRPGRPFVTEPKTEPSYPDLLRLIGRRVVSTQFTLAQERGCTQSQISQQLKKLEAEEFICRERVPTVFDKNVNEEIITLSGTGIAFCRKDKKSKRVKPCEYDLSKGEHKHHLVTNIVAALDSVEARARYYGSNAKDTAIHSEIAGGRKQLPDILGDVTHERCSPAFDVPIEVECSLDIKRIRFKARSYMASEKDRVVIICLEKWMAEKYKEDLHEHRRKLLSLNATETQFDFFYLEKVRVRGKTVYRLVFIGTLMTGP